MPKMIVAVLFALCGASAQVLTTCDVLRRLDELNGKELKVRGTWRGGHTGQFLLSSEDCGRATIRDGWFWPDAIQVAPENLGAGAWTAKYRISSRNRKDPEPMEIVVTLSGHLKTRVHFEVQTGADGTQRPVAFKYCVAALVYWNAADVQAVGYRTEALERVVDFLQRPFAKRVEQ